MLAILLAGALAGCGPGLEESRQGIRDGRGQEINGQRFAPHVILIHGAWMGSWVWEETAQRLRGEGANVTVVTLPAHYTDPMLASEATLDAYVSRLAEVVNAGPTPVSLVGHSMAGMVISQYAEREPTKVRDLVYFAAFLPADGETMLSLAVQDSSLALANVSMDTVALVANLPLSQLGPIMCADCSAAEVARIESNYREEPLVPMNIPVSLTAANFGSIPKKYVFTVEDQAITYPFQQTMAARVPLAATRTLRTSHTPQMSNPGLTTDTLKELLR